MHLYVLQGKKNPTSTFQLIENYNYYFRAHLQKKDKCSTHCMQHALSDPTEEKHLIVCDDHNHDFNCDRCELFPKSVEEIRKLVNDMEGK